MEKSRLVEVKEYLEEGYAPVIDYQSWRVAILNYCEELEPQNIEKFQKHNESDEVFVLLEGECTLFLAQGDEQIEAVHIQPLEKKKIYNVKRGVWHSHTLSKDAMVLIVENVDTDLSNSPEQTLNEEQRTVLRSYGGIRFE